MQPLKDPFNDRQVKKVRAPPHRPLESSLMFPISLQGKPDWRLLKDHLSQEGRIKKEDLIKLVSATNNIFKSESNILKIDDPVTVVGDIHGQYYDLVKILDIGGKPENTKYLFLGDFVDRGSFSIEVIVLLYSLKLNYPTTIQFIRGNHECRQMTTYFNFRDECIYKYDQEIYEIMMESFEMIPLCSIINGKFIGIHGGISPALRSLADLQKIDRYTEPPKSGLLCDLIWSDPIESEDGHLPQDFKANEVRGCSFIYGMEAVNKFLKACGLLSVIRAHEAQIDGYKMYKWNGSNEFPAVITIFSAPNYCDVYNNKGAIIKFEQNTLNIQQFNYHEHPYLLPNFMDIFTWSIPFVSEKITQILQNLVKQQKDEDFNSEEEKNYDKLMQSEEGQDLKSLQEKQQLQQKSSVISKEKQERLKSKIKAISKMAILHKVLRENSEKIVRLKGLCPDKKIPYALLSEGSEGISGAIDKFEKAKQVDSINEKRPDFIPPPAAKK